MISCATDFTRRVRLDGLGLGGSCPTPPTSNSGPGSALGGCPQCGPGITESGCRGPGTCRGAILSTPVSRVPSTVQAMIDDARRDPAQFWDRAARDVPWFRTWDHVFEHQPAPEVHHGAEFQPAFRWFIGGHTNLCYNALDHQVKEGRGGHTALIYFNERGEQRRFTYTELLQNVERVAAALRALGISRGDRVTVYMPTS